MHDTRAHFDALYQANRDPWDYENSSYEARKYAATLDALLRARYKSVLEAGCSIGILSAQLAARADHLIAVDFSALAILEAEKKLRDFAGVTVLHAALPDGWPEGRYDLIMLSELVYYLSEADIKTLAGLVARDANAGGECVLVHYLGDTQTNISPNAARNLFCETLAHLRKIYIFDHPTAGEYNHRTVCFDAVNSDFKFDELTGLIK